MGQVLHEIFYRLKLYLHSISMQLMNCNELSWGISRSYIKLQIYSRHAECMFYDVLCTCWSILHLPDLARRQWRSWWRTVRIRTLALGGRTALRQLQRVFGNTASIGTIRCRGKWSRMELWTLTSSSLPQSVKAPFRPLFQGWFFFEWFHWKSSSSLCALSWDFIVGKIDGKA